MSTVSRKVQRPTLVEQALLYMDHILSDPEGAQEQRLKVLLLDDDCRSIVNIVYSQNHLLKHRVVLVDTLDNIESRFLMKHLHGIVMFRPTDRSMTALTKELMAGNFKTYRVFAVNCCEMDIVQKVANADVFDVVEAFEEVFLDITPISDHGALVNLRPTRLNTAPDVVVVPSTPSIGPPENPISWSQWDQETLTRTTNALISTMLMTSRRPTIRYRKGNQVAERLAAELAAKLKNVHQGFPDLKAKEAVLIITDRLDDPLTPLLTQWTYEAMIHESIGFQNFNEVVLDDGRSPPQQQQSSDDAPRGFAPAPENVHILSSQWDAFFDQHRYSDYGMVCKAAAELVETYKSLNNLDRKTASLEEIKTFMANLPEAKRHTSQVLRHATIVGNLVDDVNSRNLTGLSVLEQEMVASSAVAEHSKTALDLVRNPRTDIDDALRIAIMYHLKYERSSSNITGKLKEELELRQCPRNKVALIDKMVQLAGQGYRLHEIYRTSTGSMFKAVVSSIPLLGTEVKNVLTQHQPLLKKIVNRAYNGTLSEKDYPVQPVQGSFLTPAQAVTQRCKDIIVFMVGGITYEETMLVHQINKGVVDNNVEALMNLGGGIGKAVGALAGKESDGSPDPSEPHTAKIEAHTVLVSTAMLNSKHFLKCIELM